MKISTQIMTIIKFWNYCLSLVLIDSAISTGKIYYPQVFLEECKYVVKEKKISEYIIEDIELSSDGSDRQDSNEENSNEQNSDEENSNEEN